MLLSLYLFLDITHMHNNWFDDGLTYCHSERDGHPLVTCILLKSLVTFLNQLPPDVSPQPFSLTIGASYVMSQLVAMDALYYVQ